MPKESSEPVERLFWLKARQITWLRYVNQTSEIALKYYLDIEYKKQKPDNGFQKKKKKDFSFLFFFVRAFRLPSRPRIGYGALHFGPL